MIKVSKVKEFDLQFDIDGRDCHCSLTEWTNKEGYTVAINDDGSVILFDASNDMLDTLLNLHVYASTYKEPVTDELV